MKHFKEHSVFLVIFYAWQMYMLLTEEEKAHDTDDEAPKRRLLLATGTDEKHFGMLKWFLPLCGLFSKMVGLCSILVDLVNGDLNRMLRLQYFVGVVLHLYVFCWCCPCCCWFECFLFPD